MTAKEHLHQFLVAFDQLINTFPFMGMCDETLSARAYRNKHKPGWGILKNIFDVLFFWQVKDGKLAHCEIAYHGELKRHHMPKEYQ